MDAGGIDRLRFVARPGPVEAFPRLASQPPSSPLSGRIAQVIKMKHRHTLPPELSPSLPGPRAGAPHRPRAKIRTAPNAPRLRPQICSPSFLPLLPPRAPGGRRTSSLAPPATAS